MMWFAAYTKKEELGIEHRTSISNVLYGMYILSFLKKRKINMEGFRIYLMSGSFSDEWKEKLQQETGSGELYFLKRENENCLILATAKGYVRLRRMKIPTDKLKELEEKEVYNMIKPREEKTNN